MTLGDHPRAWQSLAALAVAVLLPAAARAEAHLEGGVRISMPAAGTPSAPAAPPPAATRPSAQPQETLSPEEAGRLVTALASADGPEQAAARARLVAAGEAAVAPLMEVFSDAKASPQHRLAVFEAVVGIGRPAEVALAAALRHPDTLTREMAAQALGLIGDPEVVRPVLSALADPVPAVREKAAWALGQLGEPDAVASLVAALQQDESQEVRMTAARALGHIGCRVAVEPLIDALADPQPRLREAAAQALGLMGRRLASGSLGELGRAKAAKALMAALGDAEGTVRVAAAQALGVMRERKAVGPLAALLADAEAGPAAIKALGQIGTVPAQQALEQFLEAPREEALRKAAQDALKAMKRP